MKKLKHKFIRKNELDKGSGILTAIMGISIGTLVMMGVQLQTSTAYKLTTYDEQLQALEGIKRNIRENLDCRRTLNIPGTGRPSKQACLSSPRSIKNSAGKVLNFGDFEIKAACEDKHLKIKITKGPEIGGRKTQNWSDTSIAKDLFNGTEEFCRSYFEDEYPYTWKIAGNYMVNNLWDGTEKYCRHKNPATGACECPEGFEKYRTYEFVNGACRPGSGRPGYYADSDSGGSGSKVPNCSVIQYICIAWD